MKARAALRRSKGQARGLSSMKPTYINEPTPQYCLCCGYKTIEGSRTNFGYTTPPDTYEICSICYWQDDRVGYDNPEIAIGPNHVSLKQAQRNFLEFGAS